MFVNWGWVERKERAVYTLLNEPGTSEEINESFNDSMTSHKFPEEEVWILKKAEIKPFFLSHASYKMECCAKLHVCLLQ